jgi:ribosomal subunit interface protein
MAFDFQFTSQVKENEDALWQEAETRLSKLGIKRGGITGATVNIEKEAKAQTPHLFSVKIVVFVRPKNVVAQKKDKNVIFALKKALDTIERQIRKGKEKRRGR